MKQFIIIIVLLFLTLNLTVADTIPGNEIIVTKSMYSEQVSYDNFVSAYLLLLHENEIGGGVINDFNELYEIRKKPREIAESLFNAGKRSYERDEYRNSEMFFYGALYVYIKLYESKKVAHTLNYLGTLMQNQGKYESSMDKYILALRIYEAYGDLWGVSIVYNNIGTLYKRTGDMEKALFYVRQSLNISVHLDKPEAIAAAYTNIGNIYTDYQQFEEAIEYHHKALNVYEKMQNETGKAVIYNNIGSVYLDMGNYTEALNYLLDSYEINQQYPGRHSSTLNIMNIARIFFLQRNFSESLKWAEEGLSMSESMGSKGLDIPIFRLLISISDSLKDYQSAYNYQSRYIERYDSLWNVETRGRFEELELKYETQKKESHIEKQTLKILEQDLVLNRRNIVITFIIIGFLIIVVIGGFMFFRQRMRQQKIMDSLKLEEEKNKTRAIIEAIEEERKRIARDIHDGLGQNLATLKLKMIKISESLKAEYNQHTQEEMDVAIQSLDDTYKEARNLSHQMMPKTLLFLGLVDAISDLTEKVLHQTGIRFEFDHNVSRRFDQAVEIALYRVFQELLSNIIKHAKADFVEISLLQTSEQLMLIVQDNGVGFEEKPESEKGIGLLNIEARVKSMSGNVEISSAHMKGTSFIVRIPLN